MEWKVRSRGGGGEGAAFQLLEAEVVYCAHCPTGLAFPGLTETKLYGAPCASRNLH